MGFAKSTDDTNNSQFFITEAAERHLDFNHSIFGMLVEGEDVRDAISNVPVLSTTNQPLSPVVISHMTVFNDSENGLVMLKAAEGASGEADVTVTATDSNGKSTSQTFHVFITPDFINGGPFLSDVPEIRSLVDVPATFQL